MTDFLQNKSVTTRKAHKCWGCGREFPKGSDLRYIVSVDQGEFGSSYWCEVCDECWNRQGYDTDDGINMGDMRHNDPEAWEECRKEIESDLEAADAD